MIAALRSHLLHQGYRYVCCWCRALIPPGDPSPWCKAAACMERTRRHLGKLGEGE